MEQVLGDFRQWLEQLPSSEDDSSPAPDSALPDLSTLLGEMIALRQEVHLLTRATRQQQDQNQATLEELQGACATLEEQSSSRENESVRDIVKSLTELYDVLALAQREAVRVQNEILPFLVNDAEVEPDPEPVLLDLPEMPAGRVSFWTRLFGGSNAQALKKWEQEMQARCEQAMEQVRAQEQERRCAWGGRIVQMLTSMVTGYTMSLQRVERALQHHGLEAIPTAGQSFDPETMEVLEVVVDDTRSNNEVINEVRRGYRWDGRLFRSAQVRVAKNQEGERDQ